MEEDLLAFPLTLPSPPPQDRALSPWTWLGMLRCCWDLPDIVAFPRRTLGQGMFGVCRCPGSVPRSLIALVPPQKRAQKRGEPCHCSSSGAGGVSGARPGFEVTDRAGGGSQVCLPVLTMKIPFWCPFPGAEPFGVERAQPESLGVCSGGGMEM